MKLKKAAALVLLMGLLAGCGRTASEQPAPTTEPVTVPTTTEAYIPDLLEQAQREGVPVETPYITFYYPKQWTELRSAEVTGEGQNTRVTFRVAVADQEAELFSVVIGPEEAEGYLLGTLDGMYVYSIMNEQDPADWSEEDYMDLCRQQEYLNELILQLHEHSAFTPTV